MLTCYTHDQLCAFNHDRPPCRSVRKAIFSHRLWRSKRQRYRPTAQSRGCDGIVNKTHVHGHASSRPSSSLRLGWLNARSICNKTTAVNETIADRRLDVFAVTETWHHSSDDITLRLSAPSDYTTADAVRAHDPGHGGIVVFYRKRFTCSRLTLPVLSTFEGLCLRLSADGESFILLTVYRPGSTRTSSLFYDELSTVL